MKSNQLVDIILTEIEGKSKIFEASEENGVLRISIDSRFLTPLKRRIEREGIIYDDPGITFDDTSYLTIYYIGKYPMRHREKIIEVLPGECAITREDDENPILAVKPYFGYILFYDGKRAGVANLKSRRNSTKSLSRLLEEFGADDLYRYWIEGGKIVNALESMAYEMTGGFSFDPLDGKFGKYPFDVVANGAVLERAMKQKEMSELGIDWPVCIYNSENR